MAHSKQAWELAAEKLVDDVRWLLGYREAIVAALGELPGRDEAESRLREIHALVTALEVELARAATADDRAAVGSITRLLSKAAAAVGISITTAAAALVTTDVYDALTAVDTQADQVVKCVIEADELSIDGQPASEVTLRVDDARHEHTASEVTVEPGELRLEPGEVTLTTGDDVPADAAARPETIDARAEVHTPRVVTGRGSLEGGGELTARGQSRTIGAAIERDEAPPVTPGRRGFASPLNEPFYTGGGRDVAGEASASEEPDEATAEGTVAPPREDEATDE